MASARAFMAMLNDIPKIRVALQFIATHAVITPGRRSGSALGVREARRALRWGRGDRARTAAAENIVEASARAAGHAITLAQARLLHHLLDRDSALGRGWGDRGADGSRSEVPSAVGTRARGRRRPRDHQRRRPAVAPQAAGARIRASTWHARTRARVRARGRTSSALTGAAGRGARTPTRDRQTSAGTSAWALLNSYIDCVHTTLEKGA